MNTEARTLERSCGCTAPAARRASWWGLWCGLLGVLLAPKCPLCVAAWLALCSVSSASVDLAGLVGVVGWLRPVGAGLALSSLGFLALGWLRSERRAT